MFINKVEICGVNTSKLPLLSEEEKDALFNRVEAGDKSAREELINGNLKLVLSVVQRFSNRGENIDDLFQVGCVGLIKSIDHFDREQNVKFSTYAVPMIIGEIRRYLRDNNSIRVSRSLRDIAYKSLQVRDRLREELDREPTIEQIAKELELPISDVTVALDAIMEPVSLFDSVYHDDEDTLYVMDQIKDESETVEKWTNNMALTEAMKKLTDRERMVINRRYYSGKTQVEVAEEIGISQAQVSRLEKSAISTIKKNMT